MAAKAKWDDIQKGYENGRNDISFDKVLIVYNTRLTKHAENYAKCIGIEHVGWNSPLGNGIDAIISETRLYPVTMLKKLTKNEHEKMSEAGIVILNQLIENDLTHLKIKKKRKMELADEARMILAV